MEKLIVYTTHCPRCTTFTQLLDSKGIQYEIIDDETTVCETADAAGISNIPFGLIPGDSKLKNLQELINYVNSL